MNQQKRCYKRPYSADGEAVAAANGRRRGGTPRGAAMLLRKQSGAGLYRRGERNSSVVATADALRRSASEWPAVVHGDGEIAGDELLRTEVG